MFPTGRFFGRKTQKGSNKNISGRTNLRQNLAGFSQNGPKRAKYFICFVSFIFPIWKYWKPGKTEKPISALVWLQNLIFFYKMILKMLFLQMDRIFFTQWPKFLAILTGKCWKELGTMSLTKEPHFPCIRANFRQKNLVLQSLYAYSPLNEEGGQGTEANHPLLQVNETFKVLLHTLTKEEHCFGSVPRRLYFPALQ